MILHQTGDTIVEVLIAMAIITLVLVAAYVAVNKNSQTVQATQERSQAQKLVEEQIETLRNDKAAHYVAGLCYTASGAFATAASQCLRTANGSGAAYRMSITGPDVSHVYTVMARWTGLGSRSTDDSNVTMYYRID